MKSKIMRKALAVIMTFMMVMTAMPTVFATNVSDFTDFPTGWSSEAVRAAVDNGLLNGRTPTTLEPTGNLTRAELAAIINRAFGATIEKDISQYTDVSKSQWYYHDIAKAVNMQTFSGDNNNLMRPDDNITREEVFAVVARALVLETSDYSAISAFGDGAYVSDWAKKYVSILASKKYINGNNYGNICPKDYITREEFAQMMHNIIKTYYTKQGTFIYTGADSSLIRTGEVTLSNVTIDGDLIIGDGVGRSNVYLNNVTIKGRLLCRGGEGQVKLTNTTVERGVVVKDVNGTVHFENYRDEAPFANIAEITPASFLSRSQNNISGGGSGSSKKTYVTYYTEHYLEDYDNEGTYVLDYTQKHTKIEKGNSVGPVEGKYTGYVLNKTLGDNPDTMVKAYEGLTFKLYYDIIRYDLKINLPDSSVKDITYKYGQKISDKFNLNGYGDYEFYYTNDKGEEVIVTDTTLAGENMEIKCRALRSVTFDHNDTTGAKTTVKIGDGKKLGALPTVTRDGYKLIGWNTAADGSGTDYNESSVISADITLYAQWAEIGVDYIVTFHKNDGLGNIFKKVVVRKNNTVDEPTPAPTRTNYNFTGWYTDAECTHKFDFTTPITDNTELYAGWIKAKYSVTFNVDGAPYATADIAVGEKIGDANMPTAPSKSGYEFDGWFDGATEITKDTVVNANITATAKYTKLHTVTFMADGVEVAKVTVRDNTAIGAEKMPVDPVKSGYKFEGWFSGETEVFSTTIITADMTVEAKYTLSDKPFITITDGAAKSGEEVTLKVELSNNTAGFAALRLILDYDKDIMTLEEITDGGVLANPVMNKDGATLTWSSADDMKINGDIATLKFKIAADAATGDYNVKVKIDDCYNAAHAKVDADKKDGKISVTNPITKYTVKFMDGTTEVKSVDVVKGEKIGDANMPTASSKAGYEFDGWFDSTTEITKDTVVNANITATAKYTKLHTVTFMADGVEVAKVTVRDNTAIGAEKMPVDPVKSGYKFEGWFSGKTEVFSTTIITADMTVEAKFTLSDKPVITVSDGAAKNGEYVTLKVNLSNNKAGFAALRLILDYDKDIMTLEDITDEGVLENPVMNKGRATLTWSSADDMKLNGDIATLKFKIASDAATGDYDVKVKIDDCYNAAHTKVDADKKDGKISVTNSERMLITVSEATAKNGEYVTLKVNLSNNKAGFAALRLILDYDKDIMTLEDITDEGVLENPVMNKGGATLTWSSADDMKLEGDIATLKFKIADGAPAGDYDVKITVDDCCNAAHAKVEADKKDGKISVTASSLFAVRFFDGAVADAVYHLSTKSVSGGSTISDSDLNKIKSKASIKTSLDGYTDGAYTHKIYPHFWYKDDSGEWAEFDSSVVINKNTDVFYCYKKIAVSGKLSLDGMTTRMITFSVPYETDTRIADTAKDAMTLGRNEVKVAFAYDDIYLKAIEKAASKSSGVLSNDGTVNMAEAKTKIVKIISASEINDEIKNYVRKTMKSGTDEKLKSVISLVTLEELSAMSGVTVPDYDTAVDWIKALRSQDKANGNDNYVIMAADALYGAISAKPYYTEFINSFKNEDDTFKVNNDNADFVLAVATAVNEYTYAELKTRIHSVFGGIVDLVGDAAAEDFMRDAQDRYYSGANDLWDSIKSGSVTEADYDAFLTFRMNPIEHIFKPIYNQRHQKIIDRLKADGKFYYDENPYLRELVEISADEIVADLFATTSAAGSSGYALYPSTSSESGIMHYYDYALEKMKLADKAAMWYKNEKGLSDSETETLKENIYDEIAKSINETNSSIDAYVADGTLPMNLTVDTLKTITAFASLYDSYESKIDSAINKYKGRKYYGKTWDKESVAADKELSKSVEILLGLDDPTYNADNFMNESEMWNRLEFKPFVYANDDVDETQSVKAYERTLRGNYLSLRSYLSY